MFTKISKLYIYIKFITSVFLNGRPDMKTSVPKQLPEKDPIWLNLNLVYVEPHKTSPDHSASLDSSTIKITIISWETVYGTHLLYLHLGLDIPNKMNTSISKPISNQSLDTLKEFYIEFEVKKKNGLPWWRSG